MAQKIDSTMLRPDQEPASETRKRKRAFIFIDLDLTIRHFVLSGAFEELGKHFDITYVFHQSPGDEKKGIHNDIAGLDLPDATTFEVTRARMGSWDRLFVATVLNQLWGKEGYRPRRELFADMIGFYRVLPYDFLALPFVFPLFKWWHARRNGVLAPLRDFLARERPNIVLHPTILTGYFVNELGPITNELRIPYIALMNSWDNPASKAVTTTHPDKLVVWGPQTRHHAIEYLGMDPDDVLSFGAAQFQIYRKPLAESDAELRAAFGVPDDGHPIVIYGGTSKGGDESRHLAVLNEAIERGDVPPCHVLYRPHPWRGPLVAGERSFYDLNLRHVVMDPHLDAHYRRATQHGKNVLELADYDVTRKLIRIAAGLVAAPTTLMLEFVMAGKPIVNFLPREDTDRKIGLISVLATRMPHFRTFFDSPGITQCFSESSLSSAVNRLLCDAGDSNVSSALKSHAANYIDMSDPPYGDRLLGLALQMTNAKV